MSSEREHQPLTDELLEPPVATPSRDQNAAVLGRPGHLAADLWMPGERAESIPDRRLERVAELVPAGPPLDFDQWLALETQERDRVGATAASSAAPERHDGARSTAALKLLPDRGSPHQLPSRRPQPPRGRVRPRARSASGTARLPRPCTSGTGAQANLARHAST